MYRIASGHYRDTYNRTTFELVRVTRHKNGGWVYRFAGGFESVVYQRKSDALLAVRRALSDDPQLGRES
jgi:hypothetical protein